MTSSLASEPHAVSRTGTTSYQEETAGDTAESDSCVKTPKNI